MANLRKFPQGGWLSVLLGAVLLLVMVSWIQGRRLRQDLYGHVPLAEWLPRLQS
ncbi:MAG: KUP/HAK/KT family potassium transporter [Hymenobacter sp.]